MSSVFATKDESGRQMKLEQFTFLANLDVDAYGKYMLAEAGDPLKVYAIKVLKKSSLVESDEITSVYTAKSVGQVINGERHPFLTQLCGCFQTEGHIYFATEYSAGGSLMHHLQRGAFDPQQTQLYAAEICLAIKFLHEKGIIHRNLQPGNIWLASDGHVKVADFGLCKENIWHDSRTSTFCGTAECMAPEILLDHNYGRPVDWWSFGVVLYQMLLHQVPFRGEDEDEIYDAILADEPLYPASMPKKAEQLLRALLVRAPEQRLGSGSKGTEEIMAHSYFHDIVWTDVYQRKMQPVFIPIVESETDTRNFDAEFTSKPPTLDSDAPALSEDSQDKFRDFDYMAASE